MFQTFLSQFSSGAHPNLPQFFSHNPLSAYVVKTGVEHLLVFKYIATLFEVFNPESTDFMAVAIPLSEKGGRRLTQN